MGGTSECDVDACRGVDWVDFAVLVWVTGRV